MNIQNRITKNAAEQALSEHFSDLLGSLPGSAHITQMRDKNFGALLQNGLPTRRVEAWHYTDLRRLLADIPKGKGTQAEAIRPFVDNACMLTVLDGLASLNGVTLPDGVDASLTSQNLADGAADGCYQELENDDAVGQLNSAFAQDGFAICVAEKAMVDTPIEIQAVQSGGQVHSKFPVTIGEGAKATFIERHVSTSDQAALVSCVAHIKVGANAHARWIIVQSQGASDTHLGQINVELAENAEFELYLVNAGGKVVRQEIVADVAGSGANLTLRGVNLLAGDTHTDVTLKLGHNVPDTTSTEIFRNVAFDQAKGVFQGQIKVAQIAQKTDAQMACNTLLMSDDADFSAKPELEIFADDVICAHGATVADIDPEHLFYLMARGVTEKSARALLVKGFVAEVVDELDDEALVDALGDVIANWLDKNG